MAGVSRTVCAGCLLAAVAQAWPELSQVHSLHISGHKIWLSVCHENIFATITFQSISFPGDFNAIDR